MLLLVPVNVVDIDFHIEGGHVVSVVIVLAASFVKTLGIEKEAVRVVE